MQRQVRPTAPRPLRASWTGRPPCPGGAGGSRGTLGALRTLETLGASRSLGPS
jgi:hypothetical protein